MGTSQSSKGSPSNVPMVPPWVPNPEHITTHPAIIPEAPSGRFFGARSSLNSFAKTGDEKTMRMGIGHYIKKGYGGSGTASRRFGGTVSTAEVLYNALSTTAEGEPSYPGSPLDPTFLSGRTAEEIIDAVIEAVSPIDGTQDSEVHRAAIHDALSDLLERNEEADLLNLSEIEREFVIERYIAQDVFRRFELDLGLTIQEKAPSIISALSRLKEIREYIRESVSSFFKDLKKSGKQINTNNIRIIVSSALRETFIVFEGYAL